MTRGGPRLRGGGARARRPAVYHIRNVTQRRFGRCADDRPHGDDVDDRRQHEVDVVGNGAVHVERHVHGRVGVEPEARDFAVDLLRGDVAEERAQIQRAAVQRFGESLGNRDDVLGQHRRVALVLERALAEGQMSGVLHGCHGYGVNLLAGELLVLEEEHIGFRVDAALNGLLHSAGKVLLEHARKRRWLARRMDVEVWSRQVVEREDQLNAVDSSVAVGEGGRALEVQNGSGRQQSNELVTVMIQPVEETHQFKNCDQACIVGGRCAVAL
ncbi:peptidase S58 family protein [Babesia caballi]|uniref:Peptidase S58 family protein n=1 Tax=Babesia caballi TaxID=5871 RepID=A0AAV4M0H2_BABCB|nr:peptidase S58 family protein [Babesia caballi]